MASCSPCLPSSPLLEALEFAVGGSLIALDPLGRVMFSSKLAQEQLEAFFGEERPFQAALPSTVRQWIDREMAAFRTTSVEVDSGEPWLYVAVMPASHYDWPAI